MSESRQEALQGIIDRLETVANAPGERPNLERDVRWLAADVAKLACIMAELDTGLDALGSNPALA